MKELNSYEEFVLDIFRAQFVDCSRWYPELTKEFNRDYQRLCSAVNSHGIRFVLDIMPAFRKHLDKCLSEGRLVPSNLTHFGVLGKGVVIPRLFRGLTMRIFDRNGDLKGQPDENAIRLLRQLLGVFRKLRLAASIKDGGNTVREFYRDDMSVQQGSLSWGDTELFSEEVEVNDTSFTGVITDDQRRTTDLFAERREERAPIPVRSLFGPLATLQHVADYVASALGSFDPYEWVFKHGPGSVAGQRFGEYKYSFNRWPDRLESVFPYADFAVANYALVDTVPVAVARYRGFTHEVPAKLCAVPKTIKAPRLIACEPVALQWCQQSILSYFYARTQRTFLHKFVDFRRQNKNGKLALAASHSQSHVTIDLSSASDRISCWHVERLFRRSPRLLQALQTTRSVWIEQNICKYSPKFHKLRKYSTMGNATTFPVQTIFFTTLALAALCTIRKLRICDETFRQIPAGTVRVFGDDIIVPSDVSGLLIEMLQTLGLRVNYAKTFTKGKFRESCGVDAYDGHNVSTISILDIPRSTAPSSIVSSVDVHNSLLHAGFLCTAHAIRKTAESLGYGNIRETKPDDGAFGWQTFGPPSNSHLRMRVNKSTQRLETYCLGPRSKSHRLPPGGHAGLLQFFTEAAKQVTSAYSTLGYLDRRPKSSLTLGWAPV